MELHDKIETLKLWFGSAVGAAAIAWAAILWNRVKRSAGWLSTEGVVIQSFSYVTTHNFVKQTHVKVHYKYRADRDLESDCVKAGGPAWFRDRDMKALLRKYPVGKQVGVFYDPFNPTIACFERTGMDSVLMVGGYGIFAFVVCLLLLKFA